MRILGGQFVPGQGSGCDTGLRIENGSQGAEAATSRRFVKKITGTEPLDPIEEGPFFVKKFSGPENPRESVIPNFGKLEIQAAKTGRMGNREPGLFPGFGLARMLLLEVFAMISDFLSTTLGGQHMTATPEQPVVTPRGLSTVPSFFVFDFMCESFHKSVGTQRRPLRGGKDGSVCRVM